MSKSTSINKLPNIDNSDALIKQVLDEVESSKMSSEGYRPQIPEQKQYQSLPPPQYPQQMQYPQQQPQFPQYQYNYQPPMDMPPSMPLKKFKNNSSKDLFLGVTMSDIKKSISVLVLFIVLYLPGVNSLLAKYLTFTVSNEGGLSLYGVLFKSLVAGVSYLVISKFL